MNDDFILVFHKIAYNDRFAVILGKSTEGFIFFAAPRAELQIAADDEVVIIRDTGLRIVIHSVKIEIFDGTVFTDQVDYVFVKGICIVTR